MAPSFSPGCVLDRTGPPSLPKLANDILVTIFSYLQVGDVLRIRPTCKALCRATKDKLLWIYLLRNLVIANDVPLPHYLKPIALLTTEHIEALTRRMALLAYDWDSGNLHPRIIASLPLPRSVTWLRLVSGRWLFVASSDKRSSSFACWDISAAFQGVKDPVAECFFSGPVRNADVEVQIDGVVIALAVESSSQAVEVISLREHHGSKIFVQLAHVAGCGYVKTLHGDFLGCAVKDNISIPHLVNWRTGDVYALAKLPDEAEPTITMAFWREFFIIVRRHDIQLYSMPDSSTPPGCLKTMPFGHVVWEAVISTTSTLAASLRGLFPRTMQLDQADRLHLLVSYNSHIHLYALDATKPTVDKEYLPEHFNIESVSYFDWTHGWDRISWHYTIGSTGRRVVWISEGQTVARESTPPIIFASNLCRRLPFPVQIDDKSDLLFDRAIDISNSDRLPATWAMPKHDFDESLGILAIGNTFGELALCDYVTQASAHLWSIMEDFSVTNAQDFQLLPKELVTMYISSIGDLLRPNDITGGATSVARPVGVMKEDIPPGWSNRWSRFFSLSDWQGLPCDKAWSLEHLWNISGQPELLLYQPDEDWTLFRAGGLHFFWAGGEHDLYVFHANVALPDILEALRDHRETSIASTQPLDYNLFGETIRDSFTRHLKLELRQSGRDRRREQMERGGFPLTKPLRMTKKLSWTLANHGDESEEDDETETSDTSGIDSSVEGDKSGQEDNDSQGCQDGDSFLKDNEDDVAEDADLEEARDTGGVCGGDENDLCPDDPTGAGPKEDDHPRGRSGTGPEAQDYDEASEGVDGEGGVDDCLKPRTGSYAADKSHNESDDASSSTSDSLEKEGAL